jgi:hypothetical protein
MKASTVLRATLRSSSGRADSGERGARLLAQRVAVGGTPQRKRQGAYTTGQAGNAAAAGGEAG